MTTTTYAFKFTRTKHDRNAKPKMLVETGDVNVIRIHQDFPTESLEALTVVAEPIDSHKWSKEVLLPKLRKKSLHIALGGNVLGYKISPRPEFDLRIFRFSSTRGASGYMLDASLFMHKRLVDYGSAYTEIHMVRYRCFSIYCSSLSLSVSERVFGESFCEVALRIPEFRRFLVPGLIAIYTARRYSRNREKALDRLVRWASSLENSERYKELRRPILEGLVARSEISV